MKFTIKLKDIKSIEKIDGAWTDEDYRNLLELSEYPDANTVPQNELLEMLAMALTDYEPPEAAEIVLNYKLGDQLTEGQINNIAQEMLEVKVAEQYSDMAMHFPLFNINQLLYDSFNGKFPRTIASVIEIELLFKGEVIITKEIVVRTLSDLLSDTSLLKRLFSEQLDSKEELKDAESIIWKLESAGTHTFRITSSDYWLNREDFVLEEFSGELREEEIIHPSNDDD